MTGLEIALRAFAPQIATRYIEMVRYEYTAMVKNLGPELDNVWNDWTFARTFRLLVSPVLNLDRSINEDRLKTVAVDYAEKAVISWKDKIEGKMGELEAAKVEEMNLNACSFVITGTRGGKKVAIEQTIILKCSTKGLPFNQFPARIYLDGKFISEAAYKKAA